MKSFFFYVFIFIIGFLCINSNIGFSKESRLLSIAKKRGEKPYKELINTDEYKKMGTLLKTWETCSAETKESIYVMLAFNISSKKSLKIKKVDKNIKQDLSIVGGRCAWALEELLECDLPSITATVSDKEIIKAKRIVWNKMGAKIVAAHEQEAEKIYKTLSKEEKLKIVKKKNISLNMIYKHRYFLTKLAEDEDVEIRRLVAANRKTPFRTLRKLRDKDSDPEVRKKAAENLSSARTF